MFVKTGRFSAKLLATVAALSLMGSGVAVADDVDNGDVTADVSVSNEVSATPEAQVLDNESDVAADEVTPDAEESTLDAEPTEEASDDVVLEDEADESVSDGDSVVDGEEDVDVDEEDVDADADEDEDLLDDEGGAAKNVVKDKELRKCINVSALGYTKGDSRGISAATLKKITKNVDCVGASSGAISSLEGVQYLVKVPRLSISNVRDTTSLAPLAKLKNSKMTSLSIDGYYKNKKKQKLPNLSGLSNLNYLYIYTMPLSDISNIAKNKKLTYVTIHSSGVTNVKPLAKLPKIANISLSDNGIKNISSLANIKTLEYLSVRHEKLTSIPKRTVKAKTSWGSDLKTYLDVTDNQIKDFRNAKTWSVLDGKQAQRIALKGTVKSGKTTINISALRDRDGSLPKRVYLAENNYGSLKPLTAYPGTVSKNGKTVTFKRTLNDGQWIYVEGKSIGAWYVKLTTGVVPTQKVYRLYNPRTSEHLFTTDLDEYNALAAKHGWKKEGVSWYAPKSSSAPVYRLYNRGLGDHHYTVNKSEANALVKKHGWRYDNYGDPVFYSDTGKRVPVYRQYNPRLTVGQHHYTANKAEANALVKKYKWKSEGIAWYAVKLK